MSNQTIDGVPRKLLSNACERLKVFLDHDLCECEGGHICGRTEVENILNELRALLVSEQPAPVVAIDDNVEFEKWWMSTPILRKQKIQIAQEAWFARAKLEELMP